MTWRKTDVNSSSSLVSNRYPCPVKGCHVVVFEVTYEVSEGDDESELQTDFETDNAYACAAEDDPDCQCRCCGL
jgi:hypothetical protein